MRASPCSCGMAVSYNGTLDRFFCAACDKWTEAPCTCEPRLCDFAARSIAAPERPSQLSDPAVRQAMADASARLFDRDG